MQERIAEYVAMLKAKSIKSIPDYETPARECASYFDGRGIDMPNANDWEAFKEYFTEKFKQERGRDISPTTLQQNYVARGKAFYKWCAVQDGRQQTAPLFEGDKTEAITPSAEDCANIPERKEAEPIAEPIEEKRQSDKSGSEAEKAVRTSLLIDAKTYKLLALFAALEDKTMTEILIAGARLYISEHSQEAKILQGVIDARSK